MRKLIRYLSTVLVLLWMGILSAFLITLRYILSTPKPLQSALPGEAHLFKWTHGHVYYHIFGERNAPPLLLLHTPELAASSSMLRKLADGLARHYHVYALDLLGFGQSDHPATAYSADIYVRLCCDFLIQVIGRPTTILACGLSCNYSVAVANLEPVLCERLILLAPVSLFGRAHQPTLAARLLHIPLPGLVVYATLTRRPLLRAVIACQHGYASSSISPAALDYASAVAHQFGAHHAPLAWLAGDLDLNVTAQLEQLTQPVLIFWGIRALHNKLGPASHYGLSAHTQIVLVDDAGTCLQEEQPEKVVTNILSWCSETATPLEEVAVGRQGQAVREGHITAPQMHEPSGTETSLVVPQPARPSHPSSEVEATTIPVPTPPFEETAQAEEAAQIEEVKKVVPTPSIEEQQATPVEPRAEERAAEAIVTKETEVPAAERVTEETEVQQPAEQVAMEAYCVKCKQKRPMLNPKAVITKNGRRALEASCPVCGTKLFRFAAGQ